MNLSELLIGTNMNAHPDCLGIYIGIDEIYVAQSSKRDGGVVLESLIRVPVSLVDRSRLKPLDLNEEFFTMEYWQDALSKVTAKKTWNTTKVVVSLAPEFCLLRHFVISIPLQRKEWAEGIPNEARKYIHLSFDKAVYAYHVYEFQTAATKQKRLGVVFAMTTKTIISRLEKGLKAVGLDLVSVELASLSLGRAFIDNDKEAVGKIGRIYSFFGKDNANFVFLNGSVPVLEREVEISGSIPAERRRFEITNSAEFVAKQLERDPFEEAVIVGYRTDQWVPTLEADSRKPVRKWDLKEVFGIETKSSGEVAAIGASGKFFDTKSPDIDFVKGKRLSAYEFNASWMLWKIVLVLAALMLLFMGKSYMGVLFTNYKLKLKQAASNSQTLQDFEGMTSSQLQTNLDNIRTQNETLTSVYNNSPLVTPILSAVAAARPAKIWYTKVGYSAPFPAQRAGEGRLTIEGVIDSGKESSEDLLLGTQFESSIGQQDGLQRLCANAKIKYTAVSKTDSRRGGNRRQSGRSEERGSRGTQFVLTCDNATASRGH